MSSKPWVGKSVVIIDDSPIVREELRQVFEACGVSVAGQAENGVVGLTLVAKLRPEIVSLDIIMPEMDGVECFRKLRDLGLDTKVIIVSWIAGEAKIQENLHELIPAYQFQKKPVSAQDLETRLGKVYFPEKEVLKSTAKAEPEDLEIDLLGDLGVKVS